jgi:deoxyribodipyrimidine photo-lyase
VVQARRPATSGARLQLRGPACRAAAGAALFESLLLDHDVAVNYCNWQYFAGVGNDPRNRHFKTVTQGEQYDEGAALAGESPIAGVHQCARRPGPERGRLHAGRRPSQRLCLRAGAWLPELAGLPAALRHRPWEMSEQQAAAAGYVRGMTYPEPLVEPSSQIGLGPKKAKQVKKQKAG